MIMKSYRFIISGLVQGVSYRKSVCANAQKAGFRGYVKNLSDGTVEAGVTCNRDELDTFLSILKTGSVLSEVYNIEQSDDNEIYKGDFEIRY